MHAGLKKGSPPGETAPAVGPTPPTENGRASAIPDHVEEQQTRTRRATGARAGRTTGSWARFLDNAFGSHTLALVDQAVVSGTSFATTILIGRWCGAHELGFYALGVSLLVTATCVQESLIVLPYTIYCHRRLQKTKAEYAGSVLVHEGLLSAMALIVLAVAAAALSLGGAVPGLVAVTGALAGVIPFALLREFGRRFAFAHLRMAQGLALDLAVAGVQLAGLAWLASTGALSAITAYAAVGAACVVPGALWLYLARRNFVIHREQVRPTMRQSWSLGKWLFASQITLSVQAYFTHWLLAWLIGTTATGLYAACMTVALFSNPLTLGLCNALAPRTARAFSQGGDAELRRVVLQVTLVLGITMAVFCAVVLVAGEDIMGLLFAGKQYVGHGQTVAVLAFAMLASAVGIPATNGLAAVERPDLIFRAGLFAVGLSVVLIPFLVMEWGVTGAAYGFLAGNVAGTVGRWAGFAALVWPREGRGLTATPCAAEQGDSPSTRVFPVLQQFAQSSEPSEWTIALMNEGAQATIFTVRRQDGRPIVQTHHELAVKLYKPEAGFGVEMVRWQFESLAQLHTKLNGRAVNGWQIRAPEPVFQCEQPLALVMSLVPGSSVNSCLKTAGGLPRETLDSVAEAIAAAMNRYWPLDARMHGDLNFDNVLCEAATRTLSFVDPGVLERAYLCDGVTTNWFPTSRDLAFMLFETAAAVKKNLGNPGFRVRQYYLLEKLLRAYMKAAGSPREQDYLLDEIQECVQVLLNRLQVSLSPRGLWLLVLRTITSRRINQILSRLRAQVGSSSHLSTTDHHERQRDVHAVPELDQEP